MNLDGFTIGDWKHHRNQWGGYPCCTLPRVRKNLWSRNWERRTRDLLAKINQMASALPNHCQSQPQIPLQAKSEKKTNDVMMSMSFVLFFCVVFIVLDKNRCVYFSIQIKWCPCLFYRPWLCFVDKDPDILWTASPLESEVCNGLVRTRAGAPVTSSFVEKV